jgi:hypothetical protein
MCDRAVACVCVCVCVRGRACKRVRVCGGHPYSPPYSTNPISPLNKDVYMSHTRIDQLNNDVDMSNTRIHKLYPLKVAA